MIGWLTYFGYSKVVSEEGLRSIVNKASRLVLSELEHALKVCGTAEGRYRESLKAVTLAQLARWAQIKK